MDYSGIRVGPQFLADGALSQARANKEGATLSSNLGGLYEEAAVRGQIFTLVLAATSTNIAAGHIVSAAAGANIQFGVFNPVASGKNLVLIEFGMGIISGTFPAGPAFHGSMPGVPTLAASGTPLSNILASGNASVAKCYISAAGAALTGGPAVVTHKVANFSSTATAQASPYLVNTIEYLDGKIIIPPGSGWVPLFSGAGTTCLMGLSLTWREVSL